MVDDLQSNVPDVPGEPDLISTYEGATAFSVGDPFVRLVFTYGSFLPGAEVFYGSPEGMMLDFIDAVRQAGNAHPLLALQYAAWLRDPRKGKGNRSQPPWVIAVLASIAQCVAHPRFAELTARCVVRPDDALNIVLAATVWLGDNRLPPQLKLGIAQGLDAMTDYQLVKYARTRLNLLPEKKRKKSKRQALPAPEAETAISSALTLTTPAQTGDAEQIPHERTLRLVDVLGICKKDLTPRLFALYRYLHAPTRLQVDLLPVLEDHLPLLKTQRFLCMNPPHEAAEAAQWATQALEARMTMEQMFSVTGMPSGQRQHLLALTAPADKEQQSTSGLLARLRPAQRQQFMALLSPDETLTGDPETSEEQHTASDILTSLRESEAEQLKIRTELWKTLAVARVTDENDPQKTLPFLGDVAFLRNVRGMYQAGIPLDTLLTEARRRQFSGLWPFQILSAAQTVSRGKRRGSFQSSPCPEVMPVFDPIFERVALSCLPRKSDGTFYRMLGLADISGSMSIKLGSKNASATCMDAAVSFSIAFSFTTRTAHFGGLAGTWSDRFHPAIADPDDGPLAVAQKVYKSGGGGGTQVFGSIISLINWLVKHPEVPRPEVLVVLSDMQFHPPAHVDLSLLRVLPPRYWGYITHSEFRRMPPLAAAIVLYREVLGNDISLILWNLASYEGSPIPSGMERLLMLSGFDANTLHIIERWLQADSPGSAMPTDSASSLAGTGESGSSIEAVLAELRRY